VSVSHGSSAIAKQGMAPLAANSGLVRSRIHWKVDWPLICLAPLGTITIDEESNAAGLLDCGRQLASIGSAGLEQHRLFQLVLMMVSTYQHQAVDI
jgi:hypothetical protein